MSQLTPIQEGLLYGLKQFNMPTKDAAVITAYLEEEMEQVEMMYYLATHKEATHQEIMNKFGDILEQRENQAN